MKNKMQFILQLVVAWRELIRRGGHYFHDRIQILRKQIKLYGNSKVIC